MYTVLVMLAFAILRLAIPVLLLLAIGYLIEKRGLGSF